MHGENDFWVMISRVGTRFMPKVPRAFLREDRSFLQGSLANV